MSQNLNLMPEKNTLSVPKTLLLVDGSSYLYRAFHAMPDLRAVPGDPQSAATGAIRGMINMLQSLRREVKADYAACIFDAKGPTFRDDWYPAYKATRSPMPDDLRSQIEPIYEVVRLLGWQVISVPGVEADDVIGTLAQEGARQAMQVIVSSGDKDLSQLVNERVTIIDTMNGKKRDVAGVLSEFGVPPSLMVDYQTLVGDSVDNVPGVPKVGPKTAVKWLTAYGSLDNIIEKADEIKGAVGESLRNTLAWLPQGRRLVTIRTDCDLNEYIANFPDLSPLAFKALQTPEYIDFCQKYGFKSLVKGLESEASLGRGNMPETLKKKALQSTSNLAPDLFSEVKSDAELSTEPAFQSMDEASNLTPKPTSNAEVNRTQIAAKVNYETLLNWVDFDRWMAKIEAAPLVAIDTETTAIHPLQAQIVGISICLEAGQAAYIPLVHDYPDAPAQLPRNEVLMRLKPWLENPQYAKLGQHVKFDRHVFANHGINVCNYAHDTMLQSYVLEVHRPHNLTSLALRHLDRGGISFEDLCGKGAQQIGFNQVTIEKAAPYACEDAEQTWAVHGVLWPKIAADAKLGDIYALEMQSSEALFRIERNGVLIDAATLAAQSQTLGTRIAELENMAFSLAGQSFNLASPKQIGEIFFTKLGFPIVKKTATGSPSTDEEVLEKLAHDYPLPARILEYRGLAKLKSTYTDKLAQLADPATGRVHTHYAQAVTMTGRLSSNEPNLQNIPIRTTEGRRVREAFIAAPGCFIASADYSQIELRIMAHISGDEALLRAFHTGQDVHRATAAEVFGISPDQVSSEQRRYAKVINFGLIYGMGTYGLARNLGIENKAAAAYIDRYFQRYPGVKTYMDATKLSAKAQGYVETIFGRRLYLPEINSPNGPRRSGAERAAINAPMQGTAADLIKMSMVKVQSVLDAEQRQTKMIMQVHDELVFEVPAAEVEWLKTEIPRLMANVAVLKVPLLAEVGVGLNWEQAH